MPTCVNQQTSLIVQPAHGSPGPASVAVAVPDQNMSPPPPVPFMKPVFNSGQPSPLYCA